jgi:hypothetical protein
VCDGRRVSPKAWLDASFSAAVATGDGLDYGRLWFLGNSFVPAFSGARPWMGGFGNGGRRFS